MEDKEKVGSGSTIPKYERDHFESAAAALHITKVDEEEIINSSRVSVPHPTLQRVSPFENEENSYRCILRGHDITVVAEVVPMRMMTVPKSINIDGFFRKEDELSLKDKDFIEALRDLIVAGRNVRFIRQGSTADGKQTEQSVEKDDRINGDSDYEALRDSLLR